jgi:hypothetical protein
VSIDNLGIILLLYILKCVLDRKDGLCWVLDDGYSRFWDDEDMHRQRVFCRERFENLQATCDVVAFDGVPPIAMMTSENKSRETWIL